jgi:hypothetical protein
VNDQQSEITRPVGRRTLLERRIARAAGLDRFGLPSARSLGIAPNQLRKHAPELSQVGARKLSTELLRRDRLLRKVAALHGDDLAA